MQTIQFRCPCCGIWLWTWHDLWQARKGPIYCEVCEINRTGSGKAKCEYCILYPKGHWHEPRPIFCFHVYVR